MRRSIPFCLVKRPRDTKSGSEGSKKSASHKLLVLVFSQNQYQPGSVSIRRVTGQRQGPQAHPLFRTNCKQQYLPGYTAIYIKNGQATRRQRLYC